MTQATDFSSGKGHRDENFPVASRLVRPELRAPILAFYRFARAADDIADHPTATAADKFAQLDRLEKGLLGEDGDASPEGVALRAAQKSHGITDQHALDLLEAFRRDVVKRRYASWEELMDYCRYSAAPVGRFVLDLHGEARSLWPRNDALCAALQVINHLQDCAKDYAALDRVYIPLDALAGRSIGVESLSETHASAALQAVIATLAAHTGTLLETSKSFANGIVDRRLALEVGVIQTLAESLVSRLMKRDPLSERVHHNAIEVLCLAVFGAGTVALGRLGRRLGYRPSVIPGSRQ